MSCSHADRYMTTIGQVFRMRCSPGRESHALLQPLLVLLLIMRWLTHRRAHLRQEGQTFEAHLPLMPSPSTYIEEVHVTKAASVISCTKNCCTCWCACVFFPFPLDFLPAMYRTSNLYITPLDFSLAPSSVTVSPFHSSWDCHFTY